MSVSAAHLFWITLEREPCLVLHNAQDTGIFKGPTATNLFQEATNCSSVGHVREFAHGVAPNSGRIKAALERAGIESWISEHHFMMEFALSVSPDCCRTLQVIGSGSNNRKRIKAAKIAVAFRVSIAMDAGAVSAPTHEVVSLIERARATYPTPALVTPAPKFCTSLSPS